MHPVFEFQYRNTTNVLHLYDYSGVIRIGTREYAFSPGDMTCLAKGTTYSFSTPSPGKHWCIHFTEEEIENSEEITLPNYLPLGANSHFFREQIQLISRLSNHPSSTAAAETLHLEAQHRLKALLLSIHNTATQQHTPSRSNNFLWDELIEWIEAQLNQPLTVAQVAERANVSPTTLTRKFKQAHDTTLSQFLLHRRIDKAKSLLATTSLTIYEVGSHVGIPDPQYFNKQFRKVTGISPSHYREKNQEFFTRSPKSLNTKEGNWQVDES